MTGAAVVMATPGDAPREQAQAAQDAKVKGGVEQLGALVKIRKAAAPPPTGWQGVKMFGLRAQSCASYTCSWQMEHLSATYTWAMALALACVSGSRSSRRCCLTKPSACACFQ